MNLPNEKTVKEWTRNGYTMSSDRTRIDMDVVFDFISNQSYWAQGVSRDRVERTVNGSLVLGIYTEAGEMIGFGRAVTDCASFAYLMDIFVVPEHRGKGLATWFAEAIREHPDMKLVNKWMLATRDAHKVYERAGFSMPANPEWIMQIHNPRTANDAT